MMMLAQRGGGMMGGGGASGGGRRNHNSHNGGVHPNVLSLCRGTSDGSNSSSGGDEKNAQPMPLMVTDENNPATETRICQRLSTVPHHLAFYAAFLPRSAIRGNAAFLLDVDPESPRRHLFYHAMLLMWSAARRGTVPVHYDVMRPSGSREMQVRPNHIMVIQCVYDPVDNAQIAGYFLFLYENNAPIIKEKKKKRRRGGDGDEEDENDESYEPPIYDELRDMQATYSKDKKYLARLRNLSTQQWLYECRELDHCPHYACASDDAPSWRALGMPQNRSDLSLTLRAPLLLANPNDNSHYCDLDANELISGSYSIDTAIQVKRTVAGAMRYDDGTEATFEEEVAFYKMQYVDQTLCKPFPPEDAVVLDAGTCVISKTLATLAVPDIRAMRAGTRDTMENIASTMDVAERSFASVMSYANRRSARMSWNQFVSYCRDYIGQEPTQRLQRAREMCPLFEAHFQESTSGMGPGMQLTAQYFWNRVRSGKLLSTMAVPNSDRDTEQMDPLFRFLQTLSVQLRVVCNSDDTQPSLRMMLALLDSHRFAEDSPTPRTYLVAVGPPGSGKSYRMRILAGACIPGTTDNLAHASVLAFTDDKQEQGGIIIRDELSGNNLGVPEVYNRYAIIRAAQSPKGCLETEPNTQAFTMFKLITTNSSSTSRALVLGDGGQRTAATAKSCKYHTTLAATNAPVWLVPGTCRDRTTWVYVTDQSAKKGATSDTSENAEVVGRWKEQFRDVYSFESVLQILLNAGLLPPIDNRAAFAFMQDFTELVNRENHYFATVNSPRQIEDVILKTCRSLVLLRIAVMHVVSGLGKDPVTGKLSLPLLVDQARPLLVTPISYVLFAIELNEYVWSRLMQDVFETLRRDVLKLGYDRRNGQTYLNPDVQRLNELDPRRSPMKQLRQGNYFVVSGLFAPDPSSNNGSVASMRFNEPDDSMDNGTASPFGGNSLENKKIIKLAELVCQHLPGYDFENVLGAIARMTPNMIHNCAPGFGRVKSDMALTRILALNSDGTVGVHERAQFLLDRDFVPAAVQHLLAPGTSLGSSLRGVMNKYMFKMTTWNGRGASLHASFSALRVSAAPTPSQQAAPVNALEAKRKAQMQMCIDKRREIERDFDANADELMTLGRQRRSIAANGKAPARNPSEPRAALVTMATAAQERKLNEDQRRLERRRLTLNQIIADLDTYPELTMENWRAHVRENFGEDEDEEEIQQDAEMLEDDSRPAPQAPRTAFDYEYVSELLGVSASSSLQQPQPQQPILTTTMAMAELTHERMSDIIHASMMAGPNTRLSYDRRESETDKELRRSGQWAQLEQLWRLQMLKNLGVHEPKSHWSLAINDIYNAYANVVDAGLFVAAIRRSVQEWPQIAPVQSNISDPQLTQFQVAMKKHYEEMDKLGRMLNKHHLPFSTAMVRHIWNTTLAESIICPPMCQALELVFKRLDSQATIDQFHQIAVSCFNLHRRVALLGPRWSNLLQMLTANLYCRQRRNAQGRVQLSDLSAEARSEFLALMADGQRIRDYTAHINETAQRMCSRVAVTSTRMDLPALSQLLKLYGIGAHAAMANIMNDASPPANLQQLLFEYAVKCTHHQALILGPSSDASVILTEANRTPPQLQPPAPPVVEPVVASSSSSWSSTSASTISGTDMDMGGLSDIEEAAETTEEQQPPSDIEGEADEEEEDAQPRSKRPRTGAARRIIESPTPEESQEALGF